MILRYVRRNLRRRKVRSLLMILALTVGVGTLTALNATVDSYRTFFAGTVAGSVGAFDLVVQPLETAPSPFLSAEDLIARVAAIPGVVDVAPRLHGVAAVEGGEEGREIEMVALDPETDGFGRLEATDGELMLDQTGSALPGAFVLEGTAETYDISVGDVLTLQYAAPETRLPGQESSPDSSRLRTTASWLVTGIGTQRGVTGRSGNEGVIVGLAAAQEVFGLAGAADRILLGFDPTLYDSSDPQASAFHARAVAEAVKAELGPDYRYGMPKPRAVSEGAQGFIFIQSLVAMYGVLSLAVVGLLIRTLVMTNVEEQTRDMAVLRILGAPRSHLFNMVMTEVAVLGAIGVGLGIVIGQTVNNVVIAPLIQRQVAGTAANAPLVSTSSALLAVVVAGVVLTISALAPARKAAGTKVTHAINPGVAEGIGLDDLAKMRERKVNLRLPGIGLVVLILPFLMFVAIPMAFEFGLLWVFAALIFGSLLGMIVGAALLFFVVILPFERVLLALGDVLNPISAWFTRRTVMRGKSRNNLISLMIVLSATLPAFLSTSLALEVANTATDRRLDGGAPIRVTGPFDPSSEVSFEFGEMFGGEALTFREEILTELRDDPGFGSTVGLTGGERLAVRDGLGLKDVNASFVGVDGDLASVLYPEAVQFTSGDKSSLERILSEPGTAVIAGGLETFFHRGVGDTILVDGAGRDHPEELVIVGVAQRLGGVGTFSQKQPRVQAGDATVLVGLDTYRDLTTDPQDGLPDPNKEVIQHVLAVPTAGVDEEELTGELRKRFGTSEGLGVDSTAETIKTTLEEARTGQIFLIVLTILTSVLAVFGVFAVIYVSVYGRRGEIGMLKAMGASGRRLLSIFVGEAMVLTLSATLTGVVAGVLLAYVLRMSDGFSREVPTQFAVNWTVVLAQLGLMVLASLVSAVAATHTYRRMKAVEVFRTL